jgi:U3 small nucleolar RNA-associated protein 5
LHVFEHEPEAAKLARGKSPKAPISTIHSSEGAEIMCATFIKPNRLFVAYGNDVLPNFVKISFADDARGFISNIHLLPDGSISLETPNSISLPTGSLLPKVHAPSKQPVHQPAIVGFAEMDISSRPSSLAQTATSEPTLEERLMALGLGPETDSALAESENAVAASKRADAILGTAPRAGSLQVVLVQALKTQDKSLLEYCLSSTNHQVIQATVRRLPPEYVLPFLTQVIDRIQSRPSRGVVLFPWVKAVLTLHTAYLMSVPDLPRHLSSLYQMVDGRLAIFKKLLKLSGRLDLVMSQISARSSGEHSSEPLFRYMEGQMEDDNEPSPRSGVEEEDDDDNTHAFEEDASDSGSDEDLDSDVQVGSGDEFEEVAPEQDSPSENEDEVIPLPPPKPKPKKTSKQIERPVVELAEFDDDDNDD